MSEALRRRAKHMIQEEIDTKVEDILDRTAMSDAELRIEIGEARGLRRAQQIIDEAHKREP